MFVSTKMNVSNILAHEIVITVQNLTIVHIVMLKNFAFPYFKTGDFTTGLANSIQQSAMHLHTASTAALHPVGNTTIVNNAASDNSGFVHVLFFLLGIIVLILVIVGLIKFLSTRKKKRLAQLDAINAKNTTTSLLNKISDKLKELTALGQTVTTAQSAYDNLASEFSNLAGQVSLDPTDNSLSTETYQSITQAYKDLSSNLRRIDLRDDSTVKKEAKAAKRAHKHDEIRSNVPSSSLQDVDELGVGSRSVPQSAYTSSSTTTVNYHDDNSSFVTGMLVGEALEGPSQTVIEEPVYREPETRYEQPSYDSGSSNYDSGSSSYDSGSSSYDSGSSSYDSGSSSWGSDSSSSFDSGSSSYDSGGGFDSGSSSW